MSLKQGLDLHDHAVETSASVRSIRREFADKSTTTWYSLGFTNRAGLFQETQVNAADFDAEPPVGDRIEIYYAADNPDVVSEARAGNPGDDQFGRAGVYGAIAAALIGIGGYGAFPARQARRAILGGRLL